MTAPGALVLVSGPPGAGKSTVAALLASDGPPAVHLPADDFWGFVVAGAISPYRTAAHRQNETVMGVVASAAVGYAGGGYRVFVDAVVGPWFLEPFVTAARAAGVELRWVVLRPDEETVVARAAARGPGALTAPAPVRAMYDQFRDLGRYEGHALDTGDESATTTAARVREHLAGPGSLLVAAARR
ncbi:AAA family ATPase [Streptomyces bohaiensis]|uniref:AAA family ATPase n=1 Tax=Streptomyces bohaiensis TaxID=1431344 RepID=UPI003B82A943